jgi:hypothetical protein
MGEFGLRLDKSYIHAEIFFIAQRRMQILPPELATTPPWVLVWIAQSSIRTKPMVTVAAAIRMLVATP